MITASLLVIIQGLIDVVASILPTASLPSGIDSAITWLFNNTAQYNAIFPVATILWLTSSALVIEAIVLSFKGGNWILNKIRGSG